MLSTDGETRKQLNTDLGTFEVNGLLVDPQDTRQILVPIRNGIFRSMDRGDAFTQVFPGLNPVITLGTSSLTFCNIEVGKTGSASVAITNGGPGPLLYRVLQRT